MAILLPVRRQRTVSRVLLVHALLVLSEVVAFSWHGGYRSSPPSRGVAYSGRQPDAVWWRNRRRNSSPGMKARVSVSVWQGHKNHRPAMSRRRNGEGFLELDNRIPTMAQPALQIPLLQKDKVGWTFLKPVPKAGSRPSFRQHHSSPHVVSLHYSTPAFSFPSVMNRRNKLNLMKEELDQEVMSNVISQALGEKHGAESAVKSVKSPPFSKAKAQKAATITPTQLVMTSRQLAPKDHTFTKTNPRSSSEGSSFQTFSASSGFGEVFPAVRDSFSDSPGLGFGSFVEPADMSSGFGPSAMSDIHPKPSQERSQGFGAFAESDSGHFGGGGGRSATGFGGFGSADTRVEQLGSSSMSGDTDGLSVGAGSFSQDDRDCDTILTKSCTGDSDCLCYGFYFCNSDSKCEDVTASSPDAGPITFGEEWHDGPAETLGLTGRRR